MKSNAPGRVNKIFLLIMASASFLLHGRKPNPHNARRAAAVRAQLQSDRDFLALCYLIATNDTVASYYASSRASFFGRPRVSADHIREERINHAESAQDIARSLLAINSDMTVTPVGRPQEYTLYPAPGTIGDAAIADHVNALGTLRVQDMLNTVQRFLQANTRDR